MIPKIIHNIGPELWHPLWYPCYNSFKKNFKDFEFKYYNDTKDLDNLIKQFPEFYNFYYSLPYKIIKIDFAKLCILYKYGGIFTDLDIFCYQNFYNDLDRPINTIGTINYLKNGLIACEVKNEIIYECLNLIKDNYINVDKNLSYSLFVLHTAGSKILNDIYQKYNYKIKRLPPKLFNNLAGTYSPEYKTKHILTSTWLNGIPNENSYLHIINGEIIYESLDDLKTQKLIDLISSNYDNYIPVQIKDFDFYYDYGHGNRVCKESEVSNILNHIGRLIKENNI